MSGETNLILREYEISKDNIRWVMGQLVTVCGTLIAISVVVFRLIFTGETQPIEQTAVLTIMIIVLVNLVFAFLCYQNVQIIALQRHIRSLEFRLRDKETFRWESKIAQIWYGSDVTSILFNALVGLPAIALVVTLYFSLGVTANWSNWFWIVLGSNVAYAGALGLCFRTIVTRIVEVIPILGISQEDRG